MIAGVGYFTAKTRHLYVCQRSHCLFLLRTLACDKLPLVRTSHTLRRKTWLILSTQTPTPGSALSEDGATTLTMTIRRILVSGDKITADLL